MISLDKMKELDPTLKDMSDESLDFMRREYYAVVEMAFELWWEEKKSSKNPVWLFSSDGRGDKI